MPRKKRQVKYCIKVVTKVPLSQGYYYRSMLASKAQLKYAIGRKTTPKFGPVFCYPLIGRGIYDALFFSAYFNTRHALLCEYEPYKKDVEYIISPAYGFDNSHLAIFWTSGEIPDGLWYLYGKEAIPDKSSMLSPVGTSVRDGHMLFAKYVKPVAFVDDDTLHGWLDDSTTIPEEYLKKEE